MPTVILTWHACKHKVHKLHQRYIIWMWFCMNLGLVLFQILDYSALTTVAGCNMSETIPCTVIPTISCCQYGTMSPTWSVSPKWLGFQYNLPCRHSHHGGSPKCRKTYILSIWHDICKALSSLQLKWMLHHSWSYLMLHYAFPALMAQIRTLVWLYDSLYAGYSLHAGWNQHSFLEWRRHPTISPKKHLRKTYYCFDNLPP